MTRSCPLPAVVAAALAAAAVAAAALHSGTAAAGELAAAGTGSAAPDSPCIAAALPAVVAAAVQMLAAVPESQCTAAAMEPLQSRWVEAPIRPGSPLAAGHTVAAAVVAGHTAAGQVGRCCRPLSMSWTRRTWRASGRGRIGGLRGAHAHATGRNMQRASGVIVS